MDKKTLRKTMLAIRQNVMDRESKQVAVADKLFGLFPEPQSVFCYESLKSELSTIEIIKHYSTISEVCVPEVSDVYMLHKKNDGMYRQSPCEITIVPLIAFDKNLNRLGFGGGYYDRYLSTHATVSVGIAFDEQLTDELETESTDISLDYIITPAKVYKNESKRR